MADIRAAFESWCVNEMNADPDNLERLTGGNTYRVHNVQCWWMGWQAAAAFAESLAQPVPQPETLGCSGYVQVPNLKPAQPAPDRREMAERIADRLWKMGATFTKESFRAAIEEELSR